MPTSFLVRLITPVMSGRTPESRLSAVLDPPKNSVRAVALLTPVKLELMMTGFVPGWLALIVTGFVVVLMLMTRLVVSPPLVGVVPATPIVREPVVVVALPSLMTPLELVPSERKSVIYVVPLVPVVALASPPEESVTSPVRVEATPWMVRVPRPDLTIR